MRTFLLISVVLAAYGIAGANDYEDAKTFECLTAGRVFNPQTGECARKPLNHAPPQVRHPRG
jgi:nitrite reductase/ring-hydroxylating ferredoxin subunit